MKKFFSTIGLVAALSLGVCAEPAAEAAKVKTIFDYKQELSLSDEQIASIKANLTALNDSVKQSRAKLTQLENEYKALIAKEESTPAQAKTKLEQIADATVAMRLQDLTISRKITGTMSADQRKKWKDIQAKVRATNKP